MFEATPFGVFQMLPVTAPQAPNAFFTKQDVSANLPERACTLRETSALRFNALFDDRVFHSLRATPYVCACAARDPSSCLQTRNQEVCVGSTCIQAENIEVIPPKAKRSVVAFL